MKKTVMTTFYAHLAYTISLEMDKMKNCVPKE